MVDAGLAVLADQLDMTIVTTDPADMARLNVAFRELQGRQRASVPTVASAALTVW